ncbi:hypothetical protein [Leptospira limi]|uniref:Uncharacterized protein n=1 Tax=Leptospira limi TaxID=2950023 RepID=A0ABT3LZI2_9LEPT|nr:hypothetical protein [Leptospira limi]MCW7463129.1 hypothetical protein [Leptospira limi]
MNKDRKPTRILITTKDKIIRSAEVTNYLSRLASYHYKSEVLNEINKLVAKGIELENIFILSESFKYDFAYSFLKDIQIKDKSIYSLLNIGLPITLQPNEKILKLKYGYQILNYLYDNSTMA